MRKFFTSLFAATVFGLNIVNAQNIHRTKIIANDGAISDEFGASVSIFGDYLIVGADADDDRGNASGSAYIFKRDGLNWIQQVKLRASDGAAGDFFGASVSISGDYAIVGADWDDDNGDRSGSAYIFERNASGWTQRAKLRANDGAAEDRFGRSVSISGDYVIVGAWFEDNSKGSSAGSAYIFKRGGSSWTQQAKLIASDGAAGDHFGFSVSIFNEYVIIGASDDDDNGQNSGSAYIFNRDGATWTEQVKLTASDGAAEDQYGYASITDNYAIVGALWDDDNGDRSGSAYMYKRNGSTWIEQVKLTANDGTAEAWFGSSVSISGDFAIIGARQNDENGENSGSAYIFKRNGANWVEQAKLTASDGTAEDELGWSVSIVGDYTVVSAPYGDGNTTNSGSAYVFNLSLPFVSNSIPDQFVDEDFNTYTVADLDTIFNDLNSSNLTYSAETDQNTVAIISGTNLALYSIPDFFGVSQIIVTATDEQPVSVSDTFSVTIQADNDPPTSFGLLLPFNGDTLTEVTSPIKFVWESSLDVDGDLLAYGLWISNTSLDTTIQGIKDTLFNFEGSEIFQLNSAYVWSSFVTDGSVFVASSDTFEFVIALPTDLENKLINMPKKFALFQNFPNPFNPMTSISYQLAALDHVELRVYNQLGQAVRTLVSEKQSAGDHQVQWDGLDNSGKLVSSGVYLYALKVKSFFQVRKMVLLR